MPKIPQRFPWWLSIIIAATSYYLLKYLIPGLVPETSAMYKLSQAAPTIAPIITIVFLLLGAKQLYDPVPGQEEATDSANEDAPPDETTPSAKTKR